MKTHVALVIINENKEILFVRRSMKKKTLPGIWSFPSGTQEENETFEKTAVREGMEELGVEIAPKKIFAAKELPEFSVKLEFLSCKIKSGAPRIIAKDEIDEIEWMTFQDFFVKFPDAKIGHGLIWLRNNPLVWKELT